MKSVIWCSWGWVFGSSMYNYFVNRCNRPPPKVNGRGKTLLECLSPFTDLPMCRWKSKDPVEPLVGKRNKEKYWIHVTMSLNPFSTNPDFFFLNPYPNLHFLHFFQGRILKNTWRPKYLKFHQRWKCFSVFNNNKYRINY